MNRGAVKVDHCYSMTPLNGRRTIARVTKLFGITAMAADKEHEIETLELNGAPGTGHVMLSSRNLSRDGSPQFWRRCGVAGQDDSSCGRLRRTDPVWPPNGALLTIMSIFFEWHVPAILYHGGA